MTLDQAVDESVSEIKESYMPQSASDDTEQCVDYFTNFRIYTATRKAVRDVIHESLSIAIWVALKQAINDAG